MTFTLKTISAIVPFYNEGENVLRIYEDLKRLRAMIEPKYRLQIVFMDNHSTDGSPKIAENLAMVDSDVKVIRLSRNFGYQSSIMTGYLNCEGDAAVQIDSDGEDDPTLVDQFIKKWEEGYKVVYGIRKSRVEKKWVSFLRKLFYRLIRSLSTVPLPVDAGDFRLIDKTVIEHLRSFPEMTLYVRGIISYIGFSQIGIPYDRRKRYDGRSKFSPFQALDMAWHAIASFSGRPLLIVAYLGVFFSGTTLVAGFGYLLLHLLDKVPLSTSVLFFLANLFLVGIQLFGMGIIGAYVGRIFEEVKNRPRSIIEKTIQKKIEN